MCLQRRGFQSALLWWSQTFLLDLISEILDTMPLQIRSLDISYNQSFIQQPARTTVIRGLTLNLHQGAAQYNLRLSLQATIATNS